MNGLERFLFWSAVAGGAYWLYKSVNPDKYKPWNPPPPDYIEEPQQDGSIIYRDRKTGDVMVIGKKVTSDKPPKKKRKKLRLFRKRSDSVNTE